MTTQTYIVTVLITHPYIDYIGVSDQFMFLCFHSYLYILLPHFFPFSYVIVLFFFITCLMSFYISITSHGRVPRVLEFYRVCSSMLGMRIMGT